MLGSLTGAGEKGVKKGFALLRVRYTVEVNGSAVVGIDFVHDVFEFGFGGLEAQLAHYIAELLGCDFAYMESCQ